MKTVLAIAVICVSGSGAAGQTHSGSTGAPKQVVREFLKLELEGARLTSDGRRNIAQFLAQPAPPPPYRAIFVVSDDFEITELSSKEKRLRFSVFFHKYYGEINPALFTLRPKQTSGGATILDGISGDYTVVPTEGRTKADGEERGTAGGSDWKVENPHPNPTITLATAIRYVTDAYEKTSDPSIKSNASQTLATLRKLQSRK